MASRASVRCLRLASTRLCTSGKPGSSIEVNAARCLSSSLGHHAQKKGRNDKKSEGSVYRTYNQPGVPADRGGMSIDELIEERVLPKKQSTAYAMDPEWTADLDETTIGLILEEFMRRPLVRQQAAEAGVTDKLFMKSYLSFRELCKDFSTAEPSLIVTLKDIIQDKHDVERLYPFFLAHARRVFPHLEAMDDLRIISDLTQPHNWYPEARTIQRKIFFHSGPTNSGKTFHALKRFKEAKSGVFCGPLKLLASEVFIRCQAEGFKCDMVTGEERRFAVDNLHPSPHLSCTVEMLSTSMRIEVAVIDEIQMLRDDQRGWAWTRALLGVAADEVHLCGEPAAIPMVRKLLEPIGETLEVLEYERKTPLVIADRGLGNLTEVRPADCIVCFSKKTIFSVSKKLEMLGIKTAVIYGDLPPATKLAQATKFNDPNDPINVLVATDAIGMGLNLNIRRIIFSQVTRQGKLLPNYNALQIAGRAGRFGTEHEGGVVTTLRPTDLGTLKDIMSQTIQPIARAGISPTYDQIETFSFHLPQASFVRLLDIFVSVCSVSDHFFICTVDQMKELAQFIDRIPLPLKIRYTLCCVPLSMSNKFTEAVFVKIARRLSQGQSVSADWVFDLVGWPLAPVESLEDLFNLELVYEILDSYLWLSLRFPDLFPDEEVVREGSRQIDGLIRLGIDNLMNLVPQVEERRGPRGVREAEVVEEEEDEKPKRDLKLPTKRRGNPRSIVESLISKGILSGDDAAVLKQSLFARLDQNAKDREEEEKVEREEKEQTAKDDKKE